MNATFFFYTLQTLQHEVKNIPDLSHKSVCECCKNGEKVCKAKEKRKKIGNISRCLR